MVYRRNSPKQKKTLDTNPTCETDITRSVPTRKKESPAKGVALPGSRSRSMEPKESLQPSLHMPYETALPPAVEQEEEDFGSSEYHESSCTDLEGDISPVVGTAEDVARPSSRETPTDWGGGVQQMTDHGDDTKQLHSSDRYSSSSGARLLASTYDGRPLPNASLPEHKGNGNSPSASTVETSGEAVSSGIGLASPEMLQSVPRGGFREDCCIETVMKYDPKGKEQPLCDGNSVTIIWHAVPDQQHELLKRHRKLEQRKRDSDAVDRRGIEYDPSAWKLRGGRLYPCNRATFSSFHTGATVPKYRKLAPIDDAPESEVLMLAAEEDSELGQASSKRSAAGLFDLVGLTDEPQPEEKKVAARRRGRPPKRRNVEEATNVIRVGDRFQAVIPRHPRSTADDATSGVGGASMIWDPSLAEEARARGENIDAFLAKGEELNVTTKLMEALHKGGYCVRKAMKEFIDLHHSYPDSSVELTETQAEQFGKLAGNLIGRKKDFCAAAEAIGCRKETVLVHYYRWKAKRREYALLKKERKKEPDECDVCDDGGVLIVCENCRKAFHLTCLNPPLESVPDSDWYCRHCVHYSPAKLRRLSGIHGSSSSPHYRLDPLDEELGEGSGPARRLSMESVTSAQKAALLSIHKELKPTSRSRSALHVMNGPENRSQNGSPVRKDGTSNIDGTTNEQFSDDSPSEAPSKHDTISDSSDGGYSKDSSFHDDGEEEEEEDDNESLKEKPANDTLSGGHTASGTPTYQYQVRIPISSEGLFISIKDLSRLQNGVIFAGYRPTGLGNRGVAEQAGAFRAVGDQFLSVDGISCAGKSFSEVTQLLQMSHPGQQYKWLQMAHRPVPPPPHGGSVSANQQHGNKKSISGQQHFENSRTPSVGGPADPRNRPQYGNQMTGSFQAPSFARNGTVAPPYTNPHLAPNSQKAVFAPAVGNPNYRSLPTQQTALQLLPSSGQKPAPASTAAHLSNMSATQATRLPDLVRLNIPELLAFLQNCGIETVDSFLAADSTRLATAWSHEKNIPFVVALDFIGSARLQARQLLSDRR